MRFVYTANASSRPILSTVAPDPLRKILKDHSESISDPKAQVARETIEYQLECYDNYISAPRKSFPGVPSLVDALAAKIHQTADGLDAIPDLILSHHIWGWHTITYPLFRQGLTRLESGSDGPPKKRQKLEPLPVTGEVVKDIDEWIISHEKYLGDGERLGDDWHFGLVTLADSEAVFPTSTKTNASRTIVRPTNLPGYQILSSTRASQIEIQPSTTSFKSTFDRLSDGLLKGLDWNNVFIAGGIILGALLAVPTQPDIAAQWAASDIDVYLYDLEPEAANAKLEHLFKTFRANLPKGTPTLVVRNSKTVTFYSRYPLRRVQVVLKLVKSPRAVLLNFDLDVCAMGWDGTELWMLPRAARALETGFSVFTMNLIQGHYLSERRATQEQRVFKYANRGYGIRILPSYIASLEESKSNLRRISRDEVLFKLDMDRIAQAARVWTQTVLNDSYSYTSKKPVSHSVLDNKHQLSAEPQGRSCLSGFTLLMRHVALWDLEKSGDLVIDEKHWASTNYGGPPESVLSYDDTPSYTWGKDFNIPDFKHQIDVFNLRQITDWLDEESFLEDHGIEDSDGDEFKAAKRLTYATNVAGVLKRTQDIVLPVLLPVNFAAFANQLAGQAQTAVGIKVTKILTPVVKSQKHLVVDAESTDTTEGIFLWRIGCELMWQQLDRRIDEVFEALYAFYRINDRTRGESQETRLLTQLSKRAIRPAVEDEFAAFARWVGRQPIFVDRFYNHAVSIEEIEGQISDEDEEDKD
ncbi:hypothetical protein B0H16DRAFT_1422572 [Mycena metata]|uniref:Uncharacterized protein n=1 Tax=Mycena metata TaxID=1033252 RepID=A0AAD7IIX4_9AGAR|nr:hypothetical protein B0H16DRAFT_1422572 [Mycena metata]